MVNIRFHISEVGKLQVVNHVVQTDSLLPRLAIIGLGEFLVERVFCKSSKIII